MPLGEFLGCEKPCSLTATLRKLLPKRLVRQNPHHPPCNAGRVCRVHQNPRVSCYFRQRTCLRDDHRDTVGHSFEYWKSKALIERRKHKGHRTGIEAVQLFLTHVASKQYLAL